MTERQRLDKWLWFARVVKTRSLAARLVSEGHIRLNARRIDTPAKNVVPGDVLTIALERKVRVLRVIGPGTRRGAYEEAKLLFEDLSEELEPAARGSSLELERIEDSC
jgi:ribosome-associated heat shock protein Hsp15